MAKQNIEIQQYVGGTSGYNNCYPNTGDANVKLSDGNATVWRDTLKDALPKISAMKDNQWEIGDLRYTCKNDLDEKWLKCDGNFYNLENYPILKKYFDSVGCVKEKNRQQIPEYQGKYSTLSSCAILEYERIYYIVYASKYECVIGYGENLNNLTFTTINDSYYVSRDNFVILNNQRIFGVIGEETSSTYNYIVGYFSSDLKNWSKVQFGKGSSYSLQWAKIVNNNWFFCMCTRRSSSSGRDYIAYSSDLIPSGVTEISELSRPYNYYNISLDYVDGKYINLYHNEQSSPPKLYYTTFSDLSGSGYKETILKWGLANTSKYLGYRGFFKTDEGYWLVYCDGLYELYFAFSKINNTNNFQSPYTITNFHANNVFQTENGNVVISTSKGVQFVLGIAGLYIQQTYLPTDFFKIEQVEKIVSDNNIIELESIASAIVLPNLTTEEYSVYIKAFD